MNAGTLNKRISIVQQSPTKDSYGEPLEALVTVVSTWANVKPLVGRELYNASQVYSEASTKVTIRYRANILPSMKVQYGSRILEIVSVTNVNETNTVLELVCKDIG